MELVLIIRAVYILICRRLFRINFTQILQSVQSALAILFPADDNTNLFLKPGSSVSFKYIIFIIAIVLTN